MRKKIVLVIILSFIISCTQFTWANEKENVIFVDHSKDSLLKTDYTQAEIEAEIAHRQRLEKRKLEKETQLAKLKLADKASSDVGTPNALPNITPTADSFYQKADWAGDFRLFGEVKNTGAGSCVYPQIKVKLYNASGSLIDTVYTYIDGGTNVKTGSDFTNALYPGDIGYFELMTFVSYSQVDHYTASYDYELYSHSKTKAVLEFSGTPAIGTILGDTKITGRVKNTSPYYLTYLTEVVFGIYNSSGQVIGVSLVYVDGTSYSYDSEGENDIKKPSYTTDSAIEPQATASFSCYTNAPRTQYSSYRSMFEFHEVQVVTPPVYSLSVLSTPSTGAYITVSEIDNYGNKYGTTNFTRYYDGGTVVTLTAPSTLNSGAFLNWDVDGTKYNDNTVTITMNASHAAVANYAAPSLYTLSVKSFPSSGVNITVSPADQNGKGSGATNFTRTYTGADIVLVTAPSTANGLSFSKWIVNDSSEYSTRSLNIYMTRDYSIRAVYSDPSRSYTVEVKSSGASDVAIEVDTYDKNNKKNGTTTFSRVYEPYTFVSFKAPETAGGKYFSHWTVDGTNWPYQILTLLTDKNETAVATYINNPPNIVLNRTDLYYTYVLGGNMPASQSFIVSNSGGGNMVWNVNENYGAITCNPDGATGDAIVTVSLDPTGYAVGDYIGTIYIEAGAASNTPQSVNIHLKVIEASQNQPPFGDFATPENGSQVSSSVAVTGWVVDDTGVSSVRIYYKEGKELKLIGEAIFVDGARTDIAAAYPTYPGSYKAGWGYMLLTNFLPKGDSTYELHAIATDSEGKQTDLGNKTIIVNNAAAVKPFGAIDTPAQGGSASGSKFSNVGWVLTPLPNTVPTDGSTIDVYINGVNKGHPSYNIYREDIASAFPGYNNSSGSMAKYIIDTTTYDTGIHSIFWIATDNAGNADGIGSRFFTIENYTANRTKQPGTAQDQSLEPDTGSSASRSCRSNSLIDTIPMDYSILLEYKNGTDDAVPQLTSLTENGISSIKMHENERIVIDLSGLLAPGSTISGYMITDLGPERLPLGSTLDSENAKFYWTPVLGYMGNYRLAFIVETENGMIRKDVQVSIEPKTNNN